MRAAAEGDGPLSQLEMGGIARSIESPADSRAAFAAVIGYLQQMSRNPDQEDALDDPEGARTAWQDIISAAERHNNPGKFTTFVGYEYTAGGPEFENLHLVHARVHPLRGHRQAPHRQLVNQLLLQSAILHRDVPLQVAQLFFRGRHPAGW